MNELSNRLRVLVSTQLTALIAVLVFSVSVGESMAVAEGETAPEHPADQIQMAFRDVPVLEKSFIDVSPANRDDAVPVGELGTDGGNANQIIQLAQEIAENKHDRFDSLLIAYKGKLLFESYYLRGRVNLPHPQASTTKAYTGLAIGRAIQLGYLTMDDLHKPIVSFLKELDPSRFVDGVERITLHKAMTMQSGLRISADTREQLEAKPDLLKGQLEIQAYFEHTAPITQASQTYLYQSADPTMVMHVLDAVVPGGVKEFIQTELLDKMAIRHYQWREGPSGLPRGASGASMTSRGMIKWGTVAMNKGRWNDEQLIAEPFIKRATDKLVSPGEDDIVTTPEMLDTTYGYYWWMNQMKVGTKKFLIKSAQGGGGQYIMVVEELDLVVVATAHNRRFHHETLSLLANRIIPAFVE